jgi:dihydropyrimidine dehydrogenase (NAD+) subunit PreA
VSDLVGKTVPRFVDWNDLNLDYKIVAHGSIRRRASTATSATSPAKTRRTSASTGWSTNAAQHDLVVDEEHCVGCNLCSMVCPVDECITMVRVDDGATARRGATHTWRERLSVPS